MSISIVSIVASINVLPRGEIEVRRDDNVTVDGAVIATTIHRHVVVPGDDLAGEDARVQAIAAAVWTPELIDSYRIASAIELSAALPAG